MKHLILKYYPSLSTCAYAILAVFVGGYAYNNVQRLTDFEVILVTICTFMGLKGWHMFIKHIWLKGL